jgi:hypothetical protein
MIFDNYKWKKLIKIIFIKVNLINLIRQDTRFQLIIIKNKSPMSESKNLQCLFTSHP